MRHENNGYMHISHKVDSKEIGLGWLMGITEWMSPNEYLVRFRIKQAKAMLVNTGKPLATIAKAAGFSSTSYFRSVFLKYEGRKPESVRDI